MAAGGVSKRNGGVVSMKSESEAAEKIENRSIAIGENGNRQYGGGVAESEVKAIMAASVKASK